MRVRETRDGGAQWCCWMAGLRGPRRAAPRTGASTKQQLARSNRGALRACTSPTSLALLSSAQRSQSGVAGSDLKGPHSRGGCSLQAPTHPRHPRQLECGGRRLFRWCFLITPHSLTQEVYGVVPSKSLPARFRRRWMSPTPILRRAARCRVKATAFSLLSHTKTKRQKCILLASLGDVFAC